MKTIFREVVISTFVLYIVSLFLKGLIVKGGIESYLLGGVFITAAQLILKPIFSAITLPINIMSFGLFSIIINASLLYLITIIYPKVQITSFQFQGFSFYSFNIPSFYSQLILSYLIISATITILKKSIIWLLAK